MNRIAQLFISILICSFAYGQDNSMISKIINETLNTSPDSCRVDLAVSKNVPFMEKTVMYLIPTIVENGDGYQTMNINIIFIENDKDVKYIVREKNELYSDAVRLESFDIDTTAYFVQKNNRALGVRINYNGSSRVNPYGSSTLNLYQIIDGEIINLLNEFETSSGSGENNGWDTGEWSKSESILIIKNSMTNSYNDILVKEKKTKYIYSKNEKKETKTHYEEKGILEFDNKLKKYVLQQRL